MRRRLSILVVTGFLAACGSSSDDGLRETLIAEAAVPQAVKPAAASGTPAAATPAAAPPTQAMPAAGEPAGAPAAPGAQQRPPGAPAQASSADAPGGKSSAPKPVVLTGKSFFGQSFSPPRYEANEMQLLQHYGMLEAEAVLKYDAQQVRVRLKPRPAGDSFPVAGLVLERVAGGKYLKYEVMKDEVVSSGAEIVKQMQIPRGTYRVTLQFFKSSKPARSHLEILRVVFDI